MSRGRRFAAVLGVLTLAAVLSPRTAPAVAARASTVTVAVLSVSPAVPAITTTARTLTITVALTNTTGTALTGVTLAAQRGDAIGTQAALTASLTNSAARTGGRAIQPLTAPRLTLPPGATVQTTFRTTTSVLDPSSGPDANRLCLCLPATVYPIDLTAQGTVDGTTTVLGGTRTYLPAFDVRPSRTLGVAWIWPLIDRPHRASDGNVFTDDDLTASVAGGRLDRALQVVEKVAGAVPMTLVVDPDLLDELYRMSLGAYTVRAGTAVATAGTGQQAAAAWLARLQAVLSQHPDVDVELTPPADPDVTGLAQHGLTWATGLSATVATSVTRALGGDRVPSHTLAWPPGGSATATSLDRLAAAGAGTVVLDGSRVKPSSRAGIPVSTARLRTTAGSSVSAVLTAPVLERYVEDVLTGSPGALPELLSELAVRVAQQPDVSQQAVLTAPRYVDPTDPDAAAAAVLASSRSVFSQPVTVADIAASVTSGTTASSLRRVVATSTNLSDDQLDQAGAVTGYVKPVTSLIGGSRGSAAGRQVLLTLPGAIQRSESAAWSRAGAVDAVGGGPAVGATRTRALTDQLSGYLGNVSILTPSSRSYTLASTDAPLPISVRNDNPLSVQVRVSVNTVGGLPGLPSTRTAVVSVAANSRATLKIYAHVQRSGRIPVEAQLSTADDYPLGSPVALIVHSTVLGAIGVIITIVAGVVLALALLVRYVRRVLRLRTRRARAGAPAAAADDTVRAGQGR